MSKDALWSGSRTGPWHAYATQDGTPQPRSLCGRQRLSPYPQLADAAPANRGLCPHYRSLVGRTPGARRDERRSRREVAAVRISGSRTLVVAVMHGEVLLTLEARPGPVLGSVRVPSRIVPEVVAALEQTNEALNAGSRPRASAA